MDPSFSQRACRWVAGLLAAVMVGTLLSILPGVAALAAEQSIAFVSDRDGDPEIFTVRPDGSAVVQLTSNLFWDTDPAWSPDGSKLAFSSNRDGDDDIYVMAADGRDVVNVSDQGTGTDTQPDWSADGSRLVFVRDGVLSLVSTTPGSTPTRLGRGRSPSWSPNGTKIAFAKPERGSSDIYVMNADGSNARAITSGLEADSPDWSPDGTKIAFETVSAETGGSRIATVRADGSNLVVLPGGGDDYSPSWSPDGSKLVFTNIVLDAEILVAAADGTGRTPLVSNPAYDVLPSWSPCQGTGCGVASPTPSGSPTGSPTATPSVTPTVTPTGSPSPTPTPSPTVSASPTKTATKTVLQFVAMRRRIKAAGRVTPPHPGATVHVLLSKRKRGRWVKVALKLPAMADDGDYATGFRNPKRTQRCRLTARFPGDADHLAGGRTVRFRC